VCTITFEGVSGHDLELQVGQARVSTVGMSSACPPQNLKSIQPVPGCYGFDGAGGHVGLVEVGEEVVAGLVEDLGGEAVELLGGEEVGVGLGDSRKHLFLLELVVQDRHLKPVVVLELPAEERVPEDDRSGFG